MARGLLLDPTDETKRENRGPSKSRRNWERQGIFHPSLGEGPMTSQSVLSNVSRVGHGVRVGACRLERKTEAVRRG